MELPTRAIYDGHQNLIFRASHCTGVIFSFIVVQCLLSGSLNERTPPVLLSWSMVGRLELPALPLPPFSFLLTPGDSCQVQGMISPEGLPLNSSQPIHSCPSLCLKSQQHGQEVPARLPKTFLKIEVSQKGNQHERFWCRLSSRPAPLKRGAPLPGFHPQSG